LDHFRKTGRLVVLAPEVSSPAFENFHTNSLPGEEGHRRLGLGKILADRFLLFIEVVAILGFILGIVTGLDVLRTLNQKTALAFELPNLTPTPLIRAVVIPSGHTLRHLGWN
jgi:sortase A